MGWFNQQNINIILQIKTGKKKPLFSVDEGKIMLAGKRTTRVGEQIIQALAELLMKKVKDPRVKGVTLTGISLSKDLKNAKVYFSVLGDAKAATRSKEGLDSAKGYLKREIGRIVKLKYIPDIIFEHDSTLETGNRLEALLKKIKEDELLRTQE